MASYALWSKSQMAWPLRLGLDSKAGPLLDREGERVATSEVVSTVRPLGALGAAGVL